MESAGALCEAELGALNGLFSTEEVHLMAQLFGNYPSSSSFLSEQEGGGLAFLSNHEPTNITDDILGFDENVHNSNSYYVLPQGSCFLENYHHLSNYNNAANFLVNNGSNISSMSKDSCLVNEQNNGLSSKVLPKELSNGGDSVRESGGAIAKNDVRPVQKFQAKRKTGMTQEDSAIGDQSKAIGSENRNKKSRVSRTVQGNKKNGVSKKSQKAITEVNSNDEEETNVDLNRQSSSNYSSEDDTNASQEMNGGAETSSSSRGSEALNLSRRTRARRGSATDPQSLYARKRRERINERLRILQNLVPSGTKVDISTMLEEAVQYVKFLQLQIKLLSSDDLWMYAPIAYNGMNIGLDLKISFPSL